MPLSYIEKSTIDPAIFNSLQIHFKIQAKPRNDGFSETIDPFTKARHNLKVVKLLEGIALDQNWLDLISTHLPNVEELVCQGQEYGRHFFDKLVAKTINVNLNAFQELKVFNLDFNALVPRDFECLFIRFKYINGDESYYSFKKEKKKDDKKRNYVFTPVTVKEIKDYLSSNQAVRFITMEIDKIQEFNICFNSYVPIVQFQHGVHQTIASTTTLKDVFA